MEGNFFVINKKGNRVELDFNKVLFRLNELKNRQPKLNINVPLIAQHTIKMMVNGISTRELDDISAKFCANSIASNMDYDKMAVRIEVDNLHRDTHDCFLKTVEDICDYVKDGQQINLLHPKLIKFVKKNYEWINSSMRYDMDYKYCYFGLKTLKKSYLLKKLNSGAGIIKERPQHMLMRVSIGIHLNDIAEDGTCCEFIKNCILETYNLMSSKYYTHATPTLFNAGTHRQSLSSCFLLSVDDSLIDIYKTLTQTALISKWSGGVGIHVSQLRAQNSIIRSTNGKSEGIVPVLKIFNDSAVYVSQGGGKRKGSTAVYLETWHADIEDFLNLKKPIGDELKRARDLFLALWICDVFMERLVKAVTTGEKVMWSLFCPDKAKGLTDTYGDEYRKLYHKYEDEKLYTKQIPITELWVHILEIQMESGVPYISFKDHVNRKNNQNNLGTIKSSNLCVSGDTRILTDRGYEFIEDLVDCKVNVWNGYAFSDTVVRMTGEKKRLLKVKLSNGAVLKCTPYHKFILSNGERVECQDLSPLDKLSGSYFPCVKKSNGFSVNNKVWELKSAYTAGYLAAQELHPGVIIAYHSKNILDFSLCYRKTEVDSNNNKWYYPTNYVKELSKSPPFNESLIVKMEWLSGIIDACGVISSNGIAFTYQIIHNDICFLNDVRMLCNTLGINPNIRNNKILFNEKETIHLVNNLKLSPFIVCYNSKYSNWLKQTNVSESLYKEGPYVESIEHVDGLWDTYCFNEKMYNSGVFEGVLTANCNEINIYTDKDNVGVCNLASICLSKFVERKEGADGMAGEMRYNYEKLHSVVKVAIRNLNRVIDNNVYPVEEGARSDKKNRPLGLGVQSLAKVFFKLKIPFTSKEAKEINKFIFETIYHAALEMSCELAKEQGVYETYNTSMISKGLLQMDLWNVTPSELWNWEALRNNIKRYGVRNSLLIALMPTASTAQIMGNTESFEPITSNIFVRNTLSGTFQVVNKHLVKDLQKLNLWNDNMKQKIIARDGSIQTIQEIPDNIKKVYLTVWEISQQELINMEADRNAYVCQSTSSNRYIKDPDNGKLTSMHVYEWKKGLKTGMYYLRSQSAANAFKFNVDVNILKEANMSNKNTQEDDECLMCSA